MRAAAAAAKQQTNKSTVCSVYTALHGVVTVTVTVSQSHVSHSSVTVSRHHSHSTVVCTIVSTRYLREAAATKGPKTRPHRPRYGRGGHTRGSAARVESLFQFETPQPSARRESVCDGLSDSSLIIRTMMVPSVSNPTKKSFHQEGEKPRKVDENDEKALAAGSSSQRCCERRFLYPAIYISLGNALGYDALMLRG